MSTTPKRKIINQLSKRTDMMKGSLAESARSCGKPGCKCQRGELHHGYFLSYRIKGKSKMLYVPKKSHEVVKKLTDNWHHHKDLIEKLTDTNVQLIRKGRLKKDNK